MGRRRVPSSSIQFSTIEPPARRTTPERRAMLLPTTVVGSFPQPAWLVDQAALQEHGVPRVSAADIWRIEPELLGQAQDDATLLAIAAMEQAGIDIITDGEIRPRLFGPAASASQSRGSPARSHENPRLPFATVRFCAPIPAAGSR